MSDLSQTLAKKISAREKQSKAYRRLRAASSILAVLACLFVVVLWCRSYTWRERMVVPLGESWFCRFDSDYGKFEYESYGPNMGEMSFSITALSYRDISDAWKRFTDAPQPGPGKKWRWEKSDTGRFFIHVPHWFLAVLALAIAAAPWLPWRFSLRTLLVAIAVVAAMLGFLVWINAPPQQPDSFSDLLPEVEHQNDGISADRLMHDNRNIPQAPSLDVATVLRSLDKAIGQRLQTPKMDGVESATYQYNGPIEKVFDVVAPIARESGFSVATGDVANAAAQTMKQVMANGVMKVVDHKMFTHPNGELLTVSRMEVGNSGMMMLTITYLNPRQPSGVSESSNSHQ